MNKETNIEEQKELLTEKISILTTMLELYRMQTENSVTMEEFNIVFQVLCRMSERIKFV